MEDAANRLARPQKNYSGKVWTNIPVLDTLASVIEQLRRGEVARVYGDLTAWLDIDKQLLTAEHDLKKARRVIRRPMKKMSAALLNKQIKP